MNKLTLALILFLCILVNGGCKDDPYMDKTKVFSKYLSETFESAIEYEPHYYFITSRLVCSKCIDNMLKKIMLSDIKNKEAITFVTSNPDIYPKELKENYKFLIDTEGELDYLNLDLQNLTVFETQREKIVNVALFNPLQYQEFSDYLKPLE